MTDISQPNERNPDKSGARTARRIRAILKQAGPQRASDLAEELDVTAMAVRQHLYAMAEEGLVEAVEQPQSVGRPVKPWGLTQAADAFFPDGHAELTVGLIDSLRRTLGEEAMDRIVADRAKQQTAVYKERMDRYSSLKRRLEELAAVRSEEGYMATVERDPADGAWLFVENHCPICHAASACSGLCAMELEVFRNALGNGVEVERTDHILAGARRCAYRVLPKGKN